MAHVRPWVGPQEHDGEAGRQIPKLVPDVAAQAARFRARLLLGGEHLLLGHLLDRRVAARVGEAALGRWRAVQDEPRTGRAGVEHDGQHEQGHECAADSPPARVAQAERRREQECPGGDDEGVQPERSEQQEETEGG